MTAGCSAKAVKIKEQRDLGASTVRGGDIEKIFPDESVVGKRKGESVRGITRLFFGAVLIVPAP